MHVVIKTGDFVAVWLHVIAAAVPHPPPSLSLAVVQLVH